MCSDCRGTLCVGPPTGTKDGVSLSPPPFIPICESAKAPASSTFTSGGDREGFSPPDGLYTSDSESTCYYPSSSQSIYSSISSFTAASTSTVDARSDISAHADVIEFSFQFNLMDNGEDCTAGDFSSNAESIHVGRGAGLENSLSLKIQCTESRTEVKRELAVPPIAQGGYKKRKFGSVAGSDGGTRCSGNSGDQLIIAVGSITADQCCLNASECDRIRRTTDDPCPIRPGTRDILNRTKNPPLRLAGSLMTTRALGDCYLKHKELTQQDQPLGQFVPYRGFICRPAVYFRRLLPTDRVLILSSDGLWNFLTNDDVLRVLTEMGPEPAADNSDTRILTETAISSSDSSVCAAGSSGPTNCSDYNNPSSCDPSISNRRLVRCSGKSCDTNSDATLIMSEMEVRRERCKPSAASDSAQGSSVSSARRSSRRSVTGLPTESGTLAQRLVEMAYGRANLAYAKTQPASSVAPDLRTLIGKNKRNYMDDVTVVTIRFE